MNAVALIIGVCSVSLLVILAGIDIASQPKRRARWKGVAERSGYSFLGADNDVIARYSALRIFSKGVDKRFVNAVEGVEGDLRLTLGDYHVRGGGEGGGGGACDYTLCILETAGLSMPHCHLRPRMTFYDAVWTLLGYRDIGFVEDPAFSKAYVLEGRPEVAIEGLFNATVRDWFTERKDEQLAVEMRDNLLAVHYPRRCEPEEASRLLHQSLEILNVLTRAEAVACV